MTFLILSLDLLSFRCSLSVTFLTLLIFFSLFILFVPRFLSLFKSINFFFPRSLSKLSSFLCYFSYPSFSSLSRITLFGLFFASIFFNLFFSGKFNLLPLFPFYCVFLSLFSSFDFLMSLIFSHYLVSTLFYLFGFPLSFSVKLHSFVFPQSVFHIISISLFSFFFFSFASVSFLSLSYFHSVLDPFYFFISSCFLLAYLPFTYLSSFPSSFCFPDLTLSLSFSFLSVIPFPSLTFLHLVLRLALHCLV